MSSVSKKIEALRLLQQSCLEVDAYAAPKIEERAIDYVSRGMIVDFIVSSGPVIAKARVAGSAARPYFSEIKIFPISALADNLEKGYCVIFNREGYSVASRCSCPFGQNTSTICKHALAVALYTASALSTQIEGLQITESLENEAQMGMETQQPSQGLHEPTGQKPVNHTNRESPTRQPATEKGQSGSSTQKTTGDPHEPEGYKNSELTKKAALRFRL